MIDPKVYDADYFINGVTSGKSLYTDYKWLPNLTIPMAQTIIDHLGMLRGEVVMDYGCARGYLVKALRFLGYDAYGVDISQWAIDNADIEAKPYCRLISKDPIEEWDGIDWVIAKDVLEHVEYVEALITSLMDHTKKGMFVVVPLSKFDNYNGGSRYVIDEYEKDVTHKHRFTLGAWVKMFLRPGWKVEASYRIVGVKDNYSKYEYGNGFLTARRIFE